MIQFLTDYLGVIVGALILLVSTFYLPSKIRGYVLTGGLAVLIYRTWQIYTTRGKLEKLDKERDELREQHKLLSQRADALAAEQIKLREEKDALLKKVSELKKEKAALDQNSDNLNEKKKALDNKIDELLKEHDKTADKWDSIASAMEAMTRSSQLLD